MKKRKKEFAYQSNNRFHKTWGVLVFALSIAVVIGVFMSLRYSGIAWNHTKEVLQCPYEVHTHTDACYLIHEDGTKELICGQADQVVHVHNDFCFDTDGNLVCTLAELPGHVHDESCYEDRRILCCGMEEAGKQAEQVEENTEEIVADESQMDASGDVDNITTDIITSDSEIPEEISSEETASTCLEASDESQNVMEKTEETKVSSAHVHTDECYQTVRTLVCGKLEMHEHNDSCYEEDAEGNRILKCNQLQLVAHVHTEDCLVKQDLTEEEIAKLNLDETEETKDTDEIITREYEDKKYHVLVSYTKEANIPEEAEFRVTEITAEDENYDEIEKDSQEAVGDVKIFTSLDIGFYLDGVEIEPEAEVDVAVTFLGNEFEEEEEITVIHHEQEGSVVVDTIPVDEEGQISFTAESFSVYSFGYSSSKKQSLDPGRYDGYFDLSYNDLKNAYLYDAGYERFRNENGVFGRVASNFHIVAFKAASLQSHTNGNILTRQLYYVNSSWGTNGKAYAVPEVSYIQSIYMGWTEFGENYGIGTNAELGRGMGKDGQFAEHVIVLGDSDHMPISSDWSHSYLNVGNMKLDKSSGQRIVVDHDSTNAPFIDFDEVYAEVKAIQNEMASHSQNVNVKLHLSDKQNDYVANGSVDQNNRFVEITDPDSCAYLNFTGNELNQIGTNGVPLKLFGFQTTDGTGNLENVKQGSLIINVDCSGCSDVNIPNQSRPYFDATIDQYGRVANIGYSAPNSEVVDFSAGKVIWNLYNCSGVNVYVTDVSGCVLAPDASIKVNNMNGNVVGKIVCIKGESHRTDFTGTTVPFQAKFHATKTINGHEPSMTDPAFTFTLSEWNAGQWKWNELQRTTNKGSDIYFNNIVYSKDSDIGTHYYLMQEVEGTDSGYTYDSAGYVIKVVVTKTNNVFNSTYDILRLDVASTAYVYNGVPCFSIDNNPYGPTVVNDIVFQNKTCTTIQVEKKWYAEDGKTEIRENLPAEIKVTLYQLTDDGSLKQPINPSVTLSNANNWTYKWENLPLVNDQGKGLIYYVQEEAVPDYEQMGDTLYLNSGTIVLQNKRVAKTYVSLEKCFALQDGTKVNNPLHAGEKACVIFRLYYSTNNGVNWNTSNFPITISYPESQDITIEQSSGTLYLGYKGNRVDNPATNRKEIQSYGNEYLGWKAVITGLPKYSVDSNGKQIQLQYKLVEEESTVPSFTYSYNLSEKKVISGQEPTVSGGYVNDKDGFEYTFTNISSDTTKVQLYKQWKTFSGNEDSIQQGANDNAYITISLIRTAENASDQTVIAYYQCRSDAIVEVDREGNLVAKPQFNAHMLSRKWTAEISGLPKYYVKSDGNLGLYTYAVSEVLTYGKYENQGNTCEIIDGVPVYTLVNQSTETYVLPETGGKGTVLQRIFQFWSK